MNAASLAVALDGPLPNGATATPTDSDVTVREYDPQTRLLNAVTAPGGATTRVIERDAAKRHTVIRAADGVRMVETRIAYTYYGAPTRVEELAWILKDGKGDPASLRKRVTTLAYDPQRALARVERQGVALTLERDATGAPVALIDPEGNRIALRFDAEGRLLAWALFDAKGQRLDGRLRLWDGKGALRAQLTPLGLEFAQGPTNAADALVRVDAQGGVSALAVPAPDRLEWLAPDGAARRLRVARGGAALVDAAGRAHLRRYDDFGRPVLEADPDEGRLEYRYADTSIDKRQTGLGGEAAGETLHFDFAGRLVARQRGGCTERLRYEGGLLARLEGCGNTHTFARDAFGLITVHTEAFARADGTVLRFATAYAYEDGRLAARTLPDGQVLHYRHDPVSANPTAVSREAGWLAGLRRHLGAAVADGAHRLLPAAWTESALLADVRHRPFGPATGFTQANGLASATAFDAAGRVQALRVGEVRTPIEALDYQWSATGRIGALTRNGEARHYRYDAAGRLVEEAAAAPTTPVRYAYTPLGARRAAPPARDGFGRRRTLGSRTLHYDAAHRLVEVRQGGERVARYAYDALGNRIVKTVGGRTTYFLYDLQHRLVAEADETGHIQAQYLYLDHRPYALLRAEGAAQTRTVYAVHTDPRGLPLAVTDSARRVVWRSAFSAYGAALAPAPAGFAFPLRLAGQYADAETGLYYNIHRYYDPARGEYLTPDPLGLADSDHRYGYVGGNPLGGIDPLGLFKIPRDAFLEWNNDHSDLLTEPDGGHGDILRVAFYLYAQQVQEVRFSQAIIDQIILDNYHSDAARWDVEGGAGQFNWANHMDNPNLGPPYFVDPVTGVKSANPRYKTTNWLSLALDNLEAHRKEYAKINGGTTDISTILGRFGQNTHALADFYAHSNWVDSQKMGGCYEVSLPNGYEPGGLEKRTAWVPHGMDRYTLWDGTVTPDLFSGTVCAICGDIGANTDLKHTHAYWAKDDETHPAAAEPVDPDKLRAAGLSKRDTISMVGGVWVFGGKEPIKTRKDLAMQLAILHTVSEIDRLWNKAQGVTIEVGEKKKIPLVDIFRMDAGELTAKGIQYQDFVPKNDTPKIPDRDDSN